MINLYLGLYVFFLDKKSKTNRIFIVLSIIQAIWSFLGIFLYSADDKKIVMMIFDAGWFLVISYFPVMLHFCIAISKIVKMKPWYYIVIYLPALILMYRSQSAFLLWKDLIKENNYWYFIISVNSAWEYFYIIYYHICLIGSLTLLFIWNKKSTTFKDKRQSMFIFITLLLGVLVNMVEGVILPAFTSYRTLGLSPIYASIWMIGLFYAIVKYRLLTVTHALVSKDIIANIDEFIILADNESRVLTVNNAAEQLLNCTEEKIKSHDLSELILEKNLIQKEIMEMSMKDHKSFSSRIHLIKNDNSQILIDAKFKIIRDKFRDPLGVLIIGREVKELIQFRSIYKITGRQAEIIQHILHGRSNKEIAKLIGVAERTIKGHLTAIYYKLRVNNKMELFNLLKDFNLIPEQSAEKSVLML